MYWPGQWPSQLGTSMVRLFAREVSETISVILPSLHFDLLFVFVIFPILLFIPWTAHGWDNRVLPKGTARLCQLPSSCQPIATSRRGHIVEANRSALSRSDQSGW